MNVLPEKSFKIAHYKLIQMNDCRQHHNRECSEKHKVAFINDILGSFVTIISYYSMHLTNDYHTKLGILYASLLTT